MATIEVIINCSKWRKHQANKTIENKRNLTKNFSN